MALKTLTELKGFFKEPQLMHRWEIEIPTWPPAATPSDADKIPFFVTTTDLPTETVAEAQIMLGGHTMNYVGKTDRFGEINWSFYENTDGVISQYFLKQYAVARQKFESSSSITIESKFTKELTCPIVNMNLYDPEMSNISATYQLINVMFRVSESGSLGQDPTPQEITVTAVFDAFVVIPGGA